MLTVSLRLKFTKYKYFLAVSILSNRNWHFLEYCRRLVIESICDTIIPVKQRLIPWLIFTCTLAVALWLILAHHSKKPFEPFSLTTNDLLEFMPNIDGWTFTNIPVTSVDPAEPNIMTLEAILHKNSAASGIPPSSAAIRLVHGYNMPMCMKIKGYTVDPVQLAFTDTNSTMQTQFWRVTSSLGESTYWLTTMIRASDFTPTGEDICKMAFPRVDIPDDPRWIPSGFTKEDLLHPISAFKRWSHARWNASRTDLPTFLRLKQPSWASHEQLSFITISRADKSLNAQLQPIDELHRAVLKDLQDWRTQHQPIE
jgi:hypothetical protein